MKLPWSSAKKIKMPTLARREIILACLFAVLCLGALYDRFIFEPQWERINLLKTAYSKQQQTLNTRLRQGWDNIPMLRAQSKKIKAQIDQLYREVSYTKDEPGLLVDFYTLAKAHYLRADTIKFEELKDVKDKGYSTFSVRIKLTGQNVDIYNFIEALENYPRVNRIYEFKFEPVSTAESSCSIVVEFYVLHDVQPDPMIYPWLSGEFGSNRPYRIFGLLNKVEPQSATPQVKPGQVFEMQLQPDKNQPKFSEPQSSYVPPKAKPVEVPKQIPTVKIDPEVSNGSKVDNSKQELPQLLLMPSGLPVPGGWMPFPLLTPYGNKDNQ